MSSTTPRTPKRKRSSSSLPSHLPPDAINPFSLTPSTLLQFHTAGLSDIDVDPSTTIPNFPHRGFRPKPDPEEEEDKDRVKSKEPVLQEPLQERQFHVLLQSIHHFLDKGDIEHAARAFAVLLQLRPTGAQVDIRHHNLWAIGAEILMRDGETPLSDLTTSSSSSALSPEEQAQQREQKEQRRRWGSARNMPRVRAYYETLIQQFPADERRSHKISAQDFWAALLGCEVYNVQTEYVLALSKLEAEETEDEEDEMDEVDDVNEKRRAGRDIAARERLRQRALIGMEEIERKMEEIIHDLPYRKDVALHRLRATVALFLGDLVIPLTSTSTLAEERAQIRRQGAHDQARAALESVVRLGGQLDPASIAFLGLEEEDEMLMAPMYSSLPIRQ